jgi:hypothetical protein
VCVCVCDQVGLDIVKDRVSKAHAPATAKWIKERCKVWRVLLPTCILACVHVSEWTIFDLTEHRAYEHPLSTHGFARRALSLCAGIRGRHCVCVCMCVRVLLLSTLHRPTESSCLQMAPMTT